MYEVLELEPFIDWLENLKDLRGRTAIAIRINRARGGNLGDIAPVGGGISEMRIHKGPGYRVYFLQEDQRLILLLCGGDKSTQQKDITEAKKIADEWRKDHES